MKKFFYIFLLIVLTFGSSLSVARASTENQPSAQELIRSYISNILVNKDNSIDVVETISYNAGPQERHGIYRDIYPYSSQNRKMSIDNVSVADEMGNPYIFQTSYSGQNFRIKIGDPNQTFNGQKTYVIKYHATRAVSQLKDIDEIYWNVTGNEWLVPIYQTQVSVVLPDGAISTKSACYYGPKGSTEQCSSADFLVNHFYVFNAPSKLNIGEGLTVAVGFPKGIVVPY